LVVTDYAYILESLNGPRPGCLFVFAGPSGAGKSTVCRELVRALPDIGFSVSHTTRPPRGDEVDGIHYFFVSEETFDRMAADDEFAEFAAVHGHKYGTSRAEVDKNIGQGDLLLDIDVQGAAQIRARYPAATLVFIVPPSLEELRARLEARKQNDPEDIAGRVAVAKAEISVAREFDYFIINDRLDDAVEAAENIIKAERQRVSRRFGKP
jgi:guanylate kinase